MLTYDEGDKSSIDTIETLQIENRILVKQNNTYFSNKIDRENNLDQIAKTIKVLQKLNKLHNENDTVNLLLVESFYNQILDLCKK